MPSTRSPHAAPVGAQRPRVCTVPEFHTTAGAEAAALAARAGLVLDDWQRFVLDQALGERPDGKWAAPTVGLVVGRQNGKGAILEALELAALFLFGAQLIVHTAHRQRIATSHFNRLRMLIGQVPEFQRRIEATPRGKGSEAIVLKDGRRIEFTTRMSGNARGLTADLLVYDEAMFLSESDRSALAPTMSSRSIEGNVQSWYVGSAVDQQDQAQDGVPFAQVRDAAMQGAQGVAWFEWSVPGDDPDRVPEEVAADPEMWALANPGLGIRISHEWVEHERTVDMSARGFAVERLSVGDWPDTSADAGRVIGTAAWAACAEYDRANRIVSDVAFGVDVSPDRTFGAVGVAGRRGDGLWQFAVADRRRQTDWIVDRCAQLAADYPSAVFVVLARGPAANLIDGLRDRGLRVVEASGADYGRACADFHDAVTHRTARYPAPQPDLDEALAGARRSPQEESAWTWSRKASTSPDISPLVAVTLALWGARQTGGVPAVHNLAALAGIPDAADIPSVPAPPERFIGTRFIPL